MAVMVYVEEILSRAPRKKFPEFPPDALPSYKYYYLFPILLFNFFQFYSFKYFFLYFYIRKKKNQRRIVRLLSRSLPRPLLLKSNNNDDT